MAPMRAGHPARGRLLRHATMLPSPAGAAAGACGGGSRGSTRAGRVRRLCASEARGPSRQRARKRAVQRRSGSVARPRRVVAQLVEFRSPKPAVGGSSPSGPARHLHERAGASGAPPVRDKFRPTGGDDVTETRANPTPPRDREAKKSLPARISLFYRQVLAELRKVIWPTRKELITYTTVVIFFVAGRHRLRDHPRLRLQQGGPRGLRLARSPAPAHPHADPDAPGSNHHRVRDPQRRRRRARARAVGTASRSRPPPPRPMPSAPAEAAVREADRGEAAEDGRRTRPAAEAESRRRAGRRGRRPRRREAPPPRRTPRSTPSRSSATRCAGPPATGTSCTPTPGTRTG